jgi:hypothetical protein
MAQQCAAQLQLQLQVGMVFRLWGLEMLGQPVSAAGAVMAGIIIQNPDSSPRHYFIDQ